MNGKVRERKNTIEKTDGKIIVPILPLVLFRRSMRTRYKSVWKWQKIFLLILVGYYIFKILLDTFRFFTKRYCNDIN